MATVSGIENLREIICKNDDCRKLLGYEKVKVGVMVYICPRCQSKSVFRIGYSKMRDEFDKLIHIVEKGGE